MINLWKSFNSTWFVHRVSSSFWLILTPTWLDATLCASRKIWCKFNIQEFTGKIWGGGGREVDWVKFRLHIASFLIWIYKCASLTPLFRLHWLFDAAFRGGKCDLMCVDFVSFGIQKLFCSSVQQFLERTQIFWLPCGCYMLLERKTCLCVCIMLTVLVIIYPTLKY